jgi:hypothetical protein
MATAYCMKCRKKREIKNPKRVMLKNHRPATQGVCPVCGTKVFRIGLHKACAGGCPLSVRVSILWGGARWRNLNLIISQPDPNRVDSFSLFQVVASWQSIHISRLSGAPT